MCNRLHKDSLPIPEEGIGYKFFEKEDSCFIRRNPMTSLYDIILKKYREDKDGWINWEPQEMEGDGFCFFLTEEDMNEANKEFFDCPKEGIKKIKYKGGIGTHIERTNHGSYRCALCKSFKIIEE
jgi:hypothetical protein